MTPPPLSKCIAFLNPSRMNSLIEKPYEGKKEVVG